jgi:Holliday junction DNA helicase RuvA
MIAYLEGRVLATEEHSCVLLTEGGVGYEVHAPGPVLARLPDVGGTCSLHVSTVVREDALELYGFATWDERQTFEILISISKLGPKTSLSILSRFSPDELRQVIANDDPGALTVVSGIGKKTAQHIFLELKYKLKVDDAPAAAGREGRAAGTFRDALAGLTNLGYAEDEARLVLEAAFKEEPDLDVAEALRAALKALAKGR